jgi:hypothetical protein
MLLAPSTTAAEVTQDRIRLVSYDRQQSKLLSYDQYSASIPQANREDALTFGLDYSFADAYGTPDMTAASARDLYKRLLMNGTLAEEYLDRYRGIPIGVLCENIGLCRHTLLCAINSARISDIKSCDV